MNEAEEEYDDIRSLMAFLSHHQMLNAQEMLESLLKDIRNFAQNAPQSDDLNAVFMKRH